MGWLLSLELSTFHSNVIFVFPGQALIERLPLLVFHLSVGYPMTWGEARLSTYEPERREVVLAA
jgi:hypothetical protein